MSRCIVPLVFLFSLIGLLLVGAQEAQNAVAVQVATEGEFAPHLVDAEGMSLYLYTRDEPSTSTCTDRCLDNWPPLLVEEEPVASEGVNPELLGTLERSDGVIQVTYGGWPLYRYARDAEPGDTRGQALGNAFFLVSPTGEAATEMVVEEGPQVSEEVFAALVEGGARVFTNNCAVCHGTEGQGAIGPRLAGNSNLSSANFVVQRIIHGFPEHGMPPFGPQLSDREVAAVATYIRNSWTNDFGAVPEEVVGEMR